MSDNHLIIALGGTGGKIVRALRKTIYQEYRSVEPVGVNIGYLYVDSSTEMMNPEDPTWRVLGRSVQLGTNSQLLITDASLRTRLENVESYPGIRDWIGSKEEWNDILGSIVGATLGGQKRRLGRFLFACKVDQFIRQVQMQVRVLQERGQSSVTFHICAGLAGGTGSGSIIDAIAQVRRLYPDAQNYRILVYALLPDRHPNPNWDTGNYHANGYAALMELNALSVGAWQPHDVTGDQGRLQLSDPFNGCYLFTNESGDEHFFNVSTDVPEIVASFLFQKIVIVKNVHWDTLRRMENAENGNGTPETAPNTTIAQRSKRFLAFGIKRLAIPEEEIREYITFQFARQAALQLQFNNWSDAISYADQPRNQAYQEIVKRQDVLQRWMLSDDHLILSIGILEDERKNTRWKPIQQTWQETIPWFQSLVRDTCKDRPNIWADELKMLCQKRFASEYRDLGVASFYETKKGDRKEHIREIRAAIERELIEDWRNGVQSMHDIRQLIITLLKSLQDRSLGIDDKIVTARKNAESAAQQLDITSRRWAGMGLIGAVFQRQSLFEQLGTSLKDLYNYRTYIEAWQFAKGLLQAIIGELTTLQAEIDRAASMIAEATDEFNKAIEARCNDGGLNDQQQQLIKFYDPVMVKETSRLLVRDRDEQAKQTKGVRDTLLLSLGDNPNFLAFNARISKERFIEVLETRCEESAMEAHQLFVSNFPDRQRLLGDSIIERLYQQFGGDSEAIRRYIRGMVSQAREFVSFNAEEITKVGDGIPRGVPTRLRSFTVMRPIQEARPEFNAIVNSAFREAIDVDPEFIPSPQIPCEVKSNEITLISIVNLFPLRYLKQTEFLRQKYLQRLQTGSETRLRLELHCEGNGKQYPPLYVPTSKEDMEEGLPYVLLARVTQTLDMLENPETGRKTLALITLDEFGLPNEPTLLASTLVESVDKLNAINTRLIRVEVEKKLAGADYRHIDRRSELQKAIVALLDTVKAERNNNIQDEVYRTFLVAGRKAIELLKSDA